MADTHSTLLTTEEHPALRSGHCPSPNRTVSVPTERTILDERGSAQDEHDQSKHNK
jgi:hypothetical protein